MARLQLFVLMIATWIVAINGAPIRGRPDRPERYSLESTATLRELIHEFTKRHHHRDRDGPWHASNGEPLSMWSSQFWMSLATQPSAPCSSQKVKSGTHHPHRPQHGYRGSTHHPGHCATTQNGPLASNAKDVFIVIVLSSTALVSMYLTCKVMNVCFRR